MSPSAKAADDVVGAAAGSIQFSRCPMETRMSDFQAFLICMTIWFVAAHGADWIRAWRGKDE